MVSRIDRRARREWPRPSEEVQRAASRQKWLECASRRRIGKRGLLGLLAGDALYPTRLDSRLVAVLLALVVALCMALEQVGWPAAREARTVSAVVAELRASLTAYKRPATSIARIYFGCFVCNERRGGVQSCRMRIDRTGRTHGLAYGDCETTHQRESRACQN